MLHSQIARLENRGLVRQHLTAIGNGRTCYIVVFYVGAVAGSREISLGRVARGGEVDVEGVHAAGVAARGCVVGNDVWIFESASGERSSRVGAEGMWCWFGEGCSSEEGDEEKRGIHFSDRIKAV